MKDNREEEIEKELENIKKMTKINTEIIKEMYKNKEDKSKGDCKDK